MASSGGGIYQNSANLVTINNALSWTGSNSLTLQCQGAGGLVLAGGLSTSTAGSVVSIAGGSVSFSSSSFGTGTNGNLRVGNNAPASLTIQNGAALNVGGELDVNYANTLGSASTLTLTSGSITVAGVNQTIIGRASLRTGPSNTSAAFYETGGVATLGGLLTVGYNGTATSLLDIDAGSLYANSGLVVGDGATGRTGNGSVNIHGSALVSVSGGSGLVVGQDGSLTTSGKLTLSSGTLNVAGNLVLTNSGGIGSFTRSGGSLNVTGSLDIGGVATLTLDDTSVAVPTAFGGLSRRRQRNASHRAAERPPFGQRAGHVRKCPFLNQWDHRPLAGGPGVGGRQQRDLPDLFASGQLTGPAYTSVSGSHTTVGNELLSVTGASTITGSGNPWAMRVGPYTATLTNAVTLGLGRAHC